MYFVKFITVVTEPNLGLNAWHTAKPICWHQVVVKKSMTFIAGPSKEDGQLMLKRPEFPGGFQGRVFKGNIRGECCRVPDQLADILLIGWLWGNRVVFLELTSSTFWSQPIWGLCACGQHAINFFHLVGVLVSAKLPKDMVQDIIYRPWGGTKGL